MTNLTDLTTHKLLFSFFPIISVVAYVRLKQSENGSGERSSEAMKRNGGEDGNCAPEKNRQARKKDAKPEATVQDMNTLCLFANPKAGMDAIDKKRVNEMIFAASKDSAYYKNQERKRSHNLQKVARIKGQTSLGNQGQKLSKHIEALENTRDLSRTWIVVDMDAFYASVEMRDNPSLKDKPIAVGGIAMLSTSNYEARKFGVRSAMPGFVAKQLVCVHARSESFCF